jgi:hypothetical protein
MENGRMRKLLVCRAATGRLLAAAFLMAATAARASGQEAPSLLGALTSNGSQDWSAGDLTAPAVQPILSDDYLAPVPVDGEACASCNGGGCGGYPYNRCGCQSQTFPWFRGPGNCDNWCVGPHWNVEVDGMFIHRDDAEWDRIVANVGAAPDLIDEFDFGPGVRLFVTGYNCGDYGLQAGYEGVNDFRSSALFGARSFTYDATFNSLEVNVIRKTEIPFRPFAGFRYLQIDEDFVDSSAAGSNAFQLQNRLMGFQIGAFRDAWRLNRWWTLEPVANAGAYLNSFKRELINVSGTGTTVTRRDFNEMAFVGEAGLTSVIRVNRCVALRGGYQAMVINGIGEGLDAFFFPGIEPETVVFHGARFGIEYQR